MQHNFTTPEIILPLESFHMDLFNKIKDCKIYHLHSDLIFMRINDDFKLHKIRHFIWSMQSLRAVSNDEQFYQFTQYCFYKWSFAYDNGKNIIDNMEKLFVDFNKPTDAELNFFHNYYVQIAKTL